jgi:hypothetical protein
MKMVNLGAFVDSFKSVLDMTPLDFKEWNKTLSSKVRYAETDQLWYWI